VKGILTSNENSNSWHHQTITEQSQGSKSGSRIHTM
jgi:hypothetical protein